MSFLVFDSFPMGHNYFEVAIEDLLIISQPLSLIILLYYVDFEI